MAANSGEMMRKDTLVIGSSGYLGQQVTKLFGNRAIPTHRTTSKFSNSVRYDFYEDEKLPFDTSGMTVVFTAAVEMNQPMDKLEASMKHLLSQVSDCRFVYLSSDAIFSGKTGNYTEAEQPEPINAYGRNLVACEQLLDEMLEDFCIVRPSYIFGFVNGQLDARLSRTRDTLLRGAEYAAYDDYYKCPLSVHEIADAVVYLAESTYQGPMHVAGPKMSAYEFQRRAMEALHVDTLNLVPEPMPEDENLMQDTSLDSSKWWAMRESQPMSIEDALQIKQ